MFRFVSSSFRIFVFVVLTGTIALMPIAASAQSIPPGTGRAWKINPPSTPVADLAPRASASALKEASDAAIDAAKKARDADNALVQAKTAEKNLQAEVDKVNAKQAELEKQVSMKEAALATERLQVDLASSNALDAFADINALAEPQPPGSSGKKHGAKGESDTEKLAEIRKKSEIARSLASQKDLLKRNEKELLDIKTQLVNIQAKAESTKKAHDDAVKEVVTANAEQQKADKESLAAKAAADKAKVSEGITFLQVDQGLVKISRPTDIPNLTSGKYSIAITGGDGTDKPADFKWDTNCVVTGGILEKTDECVVLVGFRPSVQGKETATLLLTNVNDTTATSLPLLGYGTSVKTCAQPREILAPLTQFHEKEIDTAKLKKQIEKLEKKDRPREKLDAAILKGRYNDANNDKDNIWVKTKIEVDFGVPLDTIYCFYQQNGPVSYLSQVKMIYNSAAGSNTLKADAGSLAFLGGVQLSIGTNVQVSTTDSKTDTTTTSPANIKLNSAADGTPSTRVKLTDDDATQATVNLANGGNLLIHAVWPVAYLSPQASLLKNFTFADFLTARDGLDLPKFSGVNTVTSDPVNHFNFSNELYTQFDAVAPEGGKDSAGSIFFDARVGYNNVSQEFASQGGFGKKANSLLGQISAGIVIVGKVSLAAQRNFGPSQSYTTDGTVGKEVTKNNFQTWSVAVTIKPQK